MQNNNHILTMVDYNELKISVNVRDGDRGTG